MAPSRFNRRATDKAFERWYGLNWEQQPSLKEAFLAGTYAPATEQRVKVNRRKLKSRGS